MIYIYDGELTKIIESTEIETMPDTSDMITPDDSPSTDGDGEVVYETPDGVTVEGDNAFPENTVVKVESVQKGEIFERAQKSLSKIAVKDKIAVFEFTATADNAVVQPDGKVKVTFDLPANLSAENLKMFYVAEDGKTEEIKITVDAANKKVVAELEHFSTYVLCNIKAGATTNADTDDNANVFPVVVLMLASLSAFVAYSKRKQRI